MSAFGHAAGCPCAGPWWSVVPPMCTCGASGAQRLPTITLTGQQKDPPPSIGEVAKWLRAIADMIEKGES